MIDEIKTVGISNLQLEQLEKIRKHRGNRSYTETINQLVIEEMERSKI